ncbi:MAG TPA: hypothetical protein VGS22_02085 [Thermoanaerobaculia bacterium]|jgi:hypothetical protein|nr:hypothetical protein [Thermoanaerobaculia bacterium]
MKKALLLSALLLLVGTVGAFAVTPVNIVYPIHGATYPITDPAPGALNSMYFTSSFSVTCGGGGHSAQWGFDTTAVGSATFYDMFSAQFVHKLPGGAHTFWVNSDCGNDLVKFRVGN